MGALAYINFTLAAATLVVFALLTWRVKTTIRYLYGAACLLMIYTMLIYGHLFATGCSLGIEIIRPTAGFMLIILLSVGVYELYRR